MVQGSGTKFADVQRDGHTVLKLEGGVFFHAGVHRLDSNKAVIELLFF